MPRSPSLRWLLSLWLATATTMASAETVPYWVTDTVAYGSVFTGAPPPVEKTVTSDTESIVDVLFASAEAHAGPAFVSAYSTARGSVDPLYYATHSAARADAELNGLEAGRYRVSFLYSVLSPGQNILAGNDAAVGYQYGNTVVELLGTGGGLHSADILIDNNAGGLVGNWIAFFAWSDSHAQLGEAGGNASMSEVELIRLPALPVPLPAGVLMLAPALGLLTGRRRC